MSLCDHPECTGRHANSEPIKSRCPAAVARKNEWSLNRYYTPTPKQRRAAQGYRLTQRRRNALQRMAARGGSEDQDFSLFLADPEAVSLLLGGK
jgi:hypothetical protein